MKKLMIALFVIGAIFGLLDVDNMTIFWISKVVAILFMLPACLIIDFE